MVWVHGEIMYIKTKPIPWKEKQSKSVYFLGEYLIELRFGTAYKGLESSIIMRNLTFENAATTLPMHPHHRNRWCMGSFVDELDKAFRANDFVFAISQVITMLQNVRIGDGWGSSVGSFPKVFCTYKISEVPLLASAYSLPVVNYLINNQFITIENEDQPTETKEV